MKRLPVEPLIAELHRRGFGSYESPTQLIGPPTVRTALSVNKARAYYRAKTVGHLTVGMADEICLELNLLPWDIWGEEWWT